MSADKKLDETNNDCCHPNGMGFWRKVSRFFKGASCGTCACGCGGCGSRSGCGVMTLDMLNDGECARVVSVDADRACLHKLADLGLNPGVEVMIQERAPFGGPIMLRVRGSLMAIRVSEAKMITVAVEPTLIGE